ncbi:MAG: fibrobacter succinogenes major paralogous domain-containing protein [Bacteroidia bacterium]|nr:fibrobacter succinogenes major paralogous domain-containing protein [Bacteroidia bacterium]
MKIKKYFIIAGLCMITLINTGCEDEPPEVTTLEAIDVGNASAVLRARIVPNSTDFYLVFECGESHDYGFSSGEIQLTGSPATVCYEMGQPFLKSGQTYYFRASLVNNEMVIEGDELTFKTTVKDKDGNDYNIVTIGTQTWMKENLKTTRLNDGTTIPVVTGASEWSGLTTPGYCWYDNNIDYKNPYGALYNWPAVNTDQLCPEGWHVPSVEEWNVLVSFLGENAVGAMKEEGIVHWNSPNSDATNTSGFTGLPGGYRNCYGDYYGLSNNGFWWSNYYTELVDAYWVADGFQISISQLSSAFALYSYSSSATDNLSLVDINDGYSVRCIRD